MTQPIPQDEVFIRKLTDIILANLENENFGVRELAIESGLPQYSLIRKLHSINNQTINQFIREVRLQKAKEILQNEDITAAEVAYRVGYSSPAYFNKCYHEYFGCSPGMDRKISSGVSDIGLSNHDSIRSAQIKNRIWLRPAIFLLLILFITAGYFLQSKLNDANWVDDMVSADGRISIAIMPFHNMTRDTVWNIWQRGIQECLMSSLLDVKELKVTQKEPINSLLESSGISAYAALSPSIAGKISEKLDARLFVRGSMKRAGTTLRVDAELTDAKTKEVIKSFFVERPFNEENVFVIIDSISLNLKNFLIASKLLKEHKAWNQYGKPNTNSAEAIRYYNYGWNAFAKGDNPTAISWYLRALEADSNYFDPMQGLSSAYTNMGNLEQNYQWVVRYYKKRDHFPLDDQLWASWAYAYSFEPPEVSIQYLIQLRQMDDQSPRTYYLAGITYNRMKQYEKAIPELEKNLEICRKWGKDFMKNNSMYFELGLAYHKTGQYKKEKNIYALAKKYIPDDLPILCRRIILELSEKDTVAADRYFEKYAIMHSQRYPTGESDIPAAQGRIYDEAGYPDKAEEYFRKAIAMDQENPKRLYTLAEFLINNNRKLNEIQELMDEAMVMASNKVDFYKYMDLKGWGLYKQGRNKEALEILQKAWVSAPFRVYTMSAHLQEVKKAVPATQFTEKSD